MALAIKARPAVTRSRYHEYTYDGIAYPGVTGIIKVLDKSDVLMAWSARQTAEAAIAQAANFPSLLATSGQEGVIRFLTARSSWKNDEAKTKGTDIHAMADLIVNGKPIPEVDLRVVREVESYVEWWQRAEWQIRLSEAYVIHQTLGYGGTFDLLAFDKDGRTVLADVKTGKGVYSETRLQLAAYGMAELVAPVESAVAYPMPQIDRYVVLHVTEAGVREIEVDVNDDDREAFRACLPLSVWKKKHAKENRL